MRVILAGGGTAGHINPALAIAEAVLQNEKDSQILFVGTKRGLESTLVPKKGFRICYIDAEGFKGKFNVRNLVPAVKYTLSVIKSKRIIKEFRPDVVVGTGGYVCAPVVAAANDMQIPTLIHEQNVFPGAAIKMLAKKSTITAVSFAESARYLKDAEQVIVTGNPLRTELLQADRAKARETLGLGDKKLVVIFGGSLGARKINDVACEYISKYVSADDVRVCMATGHTGFERVCAHVRVAQKPNIDVREYIHNMDTMMAAADVVVCRAGAITVSEICALGVPSVLVPSPNVTNNHQEYNARALSDNGAAITILEKDFNEDSLKKAIDSILDDEKAASDMRKKAISLSKRNAAEIIYEKMKKISGR